MIINGVKFNSISIYQQPELLYTLTIDSSKIDNDLTDYPLMIHLGTQSGITSADTSNIFTEVGAASGKISVETSGGTELDVEVESWDDGNQEAYLWVKVPSVLAASDTTLNLYYGSDRTVSSKVHETGSVGCQNVWSNGFYSVYHLAQSSGCLDSAGNEDMTDGNPATVDTSGIANGARAFDGVDDYMDITNTMSVSDWTLTCWFKSTWHPGNADSNFYSAINTSGLRPLQTLKYAQYTGYNNNDPFVYTQNGTGGTTLNVFGGLTAVDIGNNNWHQVTWIRDATNNLGTLYLNGSPSDPIQTPPIQAWQRLISGPLTPYDPGSYNITGPKEIGRAFNSGNYFPGSIDEVRVRQLADTPEWVKADYNSIKDDLITFS